MMKYIYRLWYVIFGIVILWIYFIFISPKIFNNKVVVIPDVIHLDEESTIKRLKDAEISYQIAYLENDEEVTLKTIPYPGTTVKKENVITVYIGKIMPARYRTHLGLLFDNVIDSIDELCKKNGILLKIEYEEIENGIGGMIIKESLIDGTYLNEVTELCLTVSVNTNSFLMPELVGLHLDDAVAILDKYGLRVNVIYYQTPIDPDIVIYQSTQPNTLIQKNTTYSIDIYVSKGMTVGSSIQVDRFIEVIHNLGYFTEINYVKSNALEHKLVAFEVQKLYDSNVVKYILWVTE